LVVDRPVESELFVEDSPVESDVSLL